MGKSVLCSVVDIFSQSRRAYIWVHRAPDTPFSLRDFKLTQVPRYNRYDKPAWYLPGKYSISELIILLVPSAAMAPDKGKSIFIGNIPFSKLVG